MTHTASFDIVSADDFLQRIVLPQYQDFLSNNASSRYALLAVIVAYHMHEWAYGRKFERAEFLARHPTKAAVADCLELARNVTNGTKHFLPKVVTRTQGGFSSGFSHEFTRPLNIDRGGGSEISADMLLVTIIDFWKQEKAAGAF